MILRGLLLEICVSISLIVLSQGHVYLGCGSNDFGADDLVSCAAGAATYHVGCDGILSGTLADRTKQCGALCLSHPDYVAFSLQNSTSCLCKKSIPSVARTSIDAADCTDSNLVFRIQEALKSSFLIRLERSDQRAVTVDDGIVGFQPRLAGSLKQNFFLRRCSAPSAQGCLGDADAWSSAAEIKSGDIVAWVSQLKGTTYLCQSSGCSAGALPPSSLSALLKIVKVEGDVLAVNGITIGFGDEVYFQSLESDSNVVCDTTVCGTNSQVINEIDSGKFIVSKAQENSILSPNAMVKLFKPGGKAAALEGLQSDMGMHTNWYLGKCGSATVKCPIEFNFFNEEIMSDVGDALDHSEAIRSGDIVTWVSQHKGLKHGMNCAYDKIPCIALTYPPEPGFQGAFFKIVKVVNDVPVANGSMIHFGDEVYFYALNLLEWAETHQIECTESVCEVRSDSSIPRSKFYLVEAGRATCSTYNCPNGFSNKVVHAASEVLNDGHCCQSEAITIVENISEDLFMQWYFLLIICGVACCCCCIGCIGFLYCRRKKKKAEEQQQIAEDNEAGIVYATDVEVVLDEGRKPPPVGELARMMHRQSVVTKREGAHPDDLEIAFENDPWGEPIDEIDLDDLSQERSSRLPAESSHSFEDCPNPEDQPDIDLDNLSGEASPLANSYQADSSNSGQIGALGELPLPNKPSVPPENEDSFDIGIPDEYGNMVLEDDINLDDLCDTTSTGPTSSEPPGQSIDEETQNVAMRPQTPEEHGNDDSFPLCRLDDLVDEVYGGEATNSYAPHIDHVGLEDEIDLDEENTNYDGFVEDVEGQLVLPQPANQHDLGADLGEAQFVLPQPTYDVALNTLEGEASGSSIFSDNCPKAPNATTSQIHKWV